MQLSVACPVNVASLAAVALMVTGVTTAAVQVAVTWIAGEAERWTEGSLTVQLEFSCTAVFAAIHWGLPVEKLEAPKVALLAGGAAVWSTVAAPGDTLNDAVQLDEEVPPQAAIPNNAAQSRTDANILNANMAACLSLCTTNAALQKELYTEPQLPASVVQ